MTAVRARLTAAMGAYLQLGTAGHRSARRLAVRRGVRRPGVRAGGAPACSRTHRPPMHRRAYRPESTYAIARSPVRLTSQARHGPSSCAARTYHEFPALDDLAGGPSTRRAQPVAGQGARGLRLRSVPLRAGRAARPWRHETDQERGSRETSRCAASHRREYSPRSATPPALGSGRSLPAERQRPVLSGRPRRPESCDADRADRRPTGSASTSMSRGANGDTTVVKVGMDTLRSATASRRRHRPLPRRGQGDRQGDAPSSRIGWRSRRTTSSSRDGRFSSWAVPNGGMAISEVMFQSWDRATTCPTAWSQASRVRRGCATPRTSPGRRVRTLPSST